MARLDISYLTTEAQLEDHWLMSSIMEDESLSQLKRARQLKEHTGGLCKCSQCGTDVKIHVSPKRNPHSGKLGRTVSLKDHDLCRRCWRQIIRSARESVAADKYYFLGPVEKRQVA
jgi:hypothetical protein